MTRAMARMVINTTAAELIKLRSLPALVATVAATVAAAAVLAVAITVSRTALSAGQAVLQSVPYLQVGLILIGVIGVGTEYTGNTMRTTLRATPNRLLVLACKVVAYLITASITSATAIGASLLAARIAQASRASAHMGRTDTRLLVGAGAYLVLTGLLSLVTALLLRSLIPPLVALLSLVLIVSPLLKALTNYAWYLPDRAGSLLYQPEAGAALTPGAGTLILLAWIATITAAALTEFHNRDA